MGRAAKTTIVEACREICTAHATDARQVEEIVPTGSIDPDNIHLPSVFVNRLYKGEQQKPIEVLHHVTCLSLIVHPQRLCLSTPTGTVSSGKKKDDQMRERIVRRAAAEFKVRDGDCVFRHPS